jgi:hypothetical protein
MYPLSGVFRRGILARHRDSWDMRNCRMAMLKGSLLGMVNLEDILLRGKVDLS